MVGLKSIFYLLFPWFFYIRKKNFLKGFFIFASFMIILIGLIYVMFVSNEYGFLLYSFFLFYLLSLYDLVNGFNFNGKNIGEEENKPQISDDFKTNEDVKKIYEDARIAMLTLNYATAEKLFLKILQINSGDMDATFQLGVLYYKMGKFRDSEKWLKKYIKQKDHNKWFIDAERILGELKSDFKSIKRI